jgi:fatty acid desaturase
MNRHQSKILSLVGVAYHLVLIGAFVAAVLLEDYVLLALAPLGALLAGLVFYGLAPAVWFEDYFIKPDLPLRVQKCLRITFNTLVLASIGFLTMWTGKPWWFYYGLFWVIPLGTSFAFFMILRQIVQHGNAGQERFTNTRIFFCNWLVNWAVFPLGNDYHLPHHLFPMVPHYNLSKLHDLLLQTEEYQKEATLVEGYFVPESPQTHPTVMDLMTQESRTNSAN